MIELTEKELDFLDRQNISLKDVCNISGMKTKEYKVFMKDNDYLIGYGGTPCKKEGHTLRLRHGHCAQCNTQGIAITQRKSMDGFLYIAISFKMGLVKVGVSNDFSKREVALKSQSYGDINDWKIVAVFEGEKIGEIENLIHKNFTQYIQKRSFKKDRKIVEAQEIFKVSVCSILTYIESYDLNPIKVEVVVIDKFDALFFKNCNSDFDVNNIPFEKEVLLSKTKYNKRIPEKNLINNNHSNDLIINEKLDNEKSVSIIGLSNDLSTKKNNDIHKHHTSLKISQDEKKVNVENKSTFNNSVSNTSEPTVPLNSSSIKSSKEGPKRNAKASIDKENKQNGTKFKLMDFLIMSICIIFLIWVYF